MSKCFKDIVGFDDTMVIAVGYPLSSIIITMLLFNDAIVRGNWPTVTICLPLSFLYTGIFWYLLRKVYVRARYHFPENNQIKKRLGVAFLAFIGIYFVVNASLDCVFEHLFVGHAHPNNPILEFTASLIISALVVTVYEALSFYLQLQRTVAEKEQLERQNVESQLEGLRNQVNPHFLFNSLNTLSYLIPEDSEKAVRFVQQLSKVYRYVLESRDAKIVSLQEELEFLKSYTFLLHERFGANLKVEIGNLAAVQQLHIVPLSMQLLFENAIKHNVISQEKTLTIEVFEEKGNLVVRNNIQRKNQVMDSTGVGINNIQNRYRLLTGKEVQVIVSQQYFTVLLPLIAS